MSSYFYSSGSGVLVFYEMDVTFIFILDVTYLFLSLLFGFF